MQTYLSQAEVKDPSVVRGRRCRCDACALSVHVVETPAPTVCPYCQRLLTHEVTEAPVAPAFPVPSDEEVRERLGKLYLRPPKLLVLLISSVAMFMLGWAIFLQLRSVENYW